MLIHSFASTYRAQYEIKLPVDRRQWHVWICAGIVKSWTDLWNVDLPPAVPLICGYLVNSACRSNLHGFLLFQNDLKLRFNAYTFNNVFHLILHKLCKLSPCCMPQTFLCRWICHNDYVMYDVLNIYWLFVCIFNGIIQAVGYSCLELEHFNGYTLDLMLQ